MRMHQAADLDQVSASVSGAASGDASAETSASVSTLALARSVEIRSDEDYRIVSGALTQILERFDQIDTKRKSWTGPLNKVLREINATFRQALGPLEEAGGVLRGKLEAYALEREQARVKAAVTGAIIPAPAEAPGITVRVVRAFRIKDPDLVPRQFCSPDPEKIQNHLDNGGLEAIRGVEFFDATESRSKRK